MPRIRIVIADDHPMIRRGVRWTLSEEPDFEVVGEAGATAELLALLDIDVPDVLILDLNMPGQEDCISFMRALHATYPRMHVLVLTAHNPPLLVKGMIEAGARGYSLKDAMSETLVHAVRQVASGALWLSPSVADAIYREAGSLGGLAHLTPREHDVLRELARGHAPDRIAETLGIRLATVRTHMKNLYSKLGVNSQVEATVLATRLYFN